MKRLSSSEIAIVAVLFNPDKGDIENICLLANDYKGVIVDNSATPSFPHKYLGQMKYICMKENKGIAVAHNTAIDIIIQEGFAKYIILIDQDSRLPDGYPLSIANEFIQIKELFPNLAALGPTVIQKETGEIYKSAIHPENYAESNFILKKDIIASGCCLSVEGLKATGLFDTSLFIDFVDTEWCYRAKSKGFIFGITPNVILKHKVGRDEIHIGKHIVSVSAPFRYYYQYRNFVILCARKYVPISFKINFGVKFLMRFFYFPFVISEGRTCWKNMVFGIKDGLKTIFKKIIS